MIVKGKFWKKKLYFMILSLNMVIIVLQKLCRYVLHKMKQAYICIFYIILYWNTLTYYYYKIKCYIKGSLSPSPTLGELILLQAFKGLRGLWTQVVSRCGYILSIVPKKKKKALSLLLLKFPSALRGPKASKHKPCVETKN